MQNYFFNKLIILTAGPRAPVGRLSGLSLHAEDGSPDTQVVMAKRLLEEDCGK